MMQRAIPDRWQDALTAYLEEYDRHLPLCAGLFPFVDEALHLLRARGLPTAIVTGKGPVSAAMSVRYFELGSLFDGVETGSPSGVVKADAIRRLVERWRVAPAHVFYAGDAAVDMDAAREAGVIAVGVAWAPGGRPADLSRAGAHVVFTEAREFLRWLETVAREPSVLGRRQA
jgi:phosphoglycolate phosphatase-like HAD superfamily hydrolase